MCYSRSQSHSLRSQIKIFKIYGVGQLCFIKNRALLKIFCEWWFFAAVMSWRKKLRLAVTYRVNQRYRCLLPMPCYIRLWIAVWSRLELSGLSFLKTIADPPKVIVTTAFANHAIEAFEEAVVDYLLKPFSYESFF